MLPDSLTTRFAVLVFLASVATLYPHSLRAQQTKQGNGNYVYVMTNQKPHNSVIQYLRSGNGLLIRIREVATGGSGTGPNGPDPLGSQDSLVLSGDGQLLLAVNAGSDDVSVLGLKNGKLWLLSRKASGGVFPNSVALSDNLVYVLNSKGEAPNITGFRLDANGHLQWLATLPLPRGSMAPNDIRFAPDGSELLVTDRRDKPDSRIPASGEWCGRQSSSSHLGRHAAVWSAFYAQRGGTCDRSGRVPVLLSTDGSGHA